MCDSHTHSTYSEWVVSSVFCRIRTTLAITTQIAITRLWKMKRFMGNFQLEIHPTTHANECNLTSRHWPNANLRLQMQQKKHQREETFMHSKLATPRNGNQASKNRKEHNYLMQQHNKNALDMLLFHFCEKKPMPLCRWQYAHTLLYFCLNRNNGTQIRWLLWLRARVVSLKRFCWSKWLVNCKKNSSKANQTETQQIECIFVSMLMRTQPRTFRWSSL